MRSTGILVGLLWAVAGAGADAVRAEPTWQAGEEYFLLQPAQPTAVAPGKVEIVEVFSYACPACNLFYPVIDKLKSSLPSSVQWRFLPASWHPEEDWKVFQRAYFAAESLGIAARTHDQVFDAIWKTGELATMDTAAGRIKAQLPTLADVAQFYERVAKLKPGAFMEAAHSFMVDARMREADAQIRAYQVDETPSLIVNGKYRLTPRSAGGNEPFMALAQWLVKLETK